jgi:hypothetical protein
MPIQHLFTKREQRIVSSQSKETLMQRTAAYWRNNGYRIDFLGPYLMHAQHLESHLGLRQVVDISITDYGENYTVDLTLSANIGDAETAVGVVGVLVVPLAAVAIGAVSYMDYDERANRAIYNYWVHIYNQANPQSALPPAPGKMKCPNCAAEIDSDSKYCRNCGIKIG